VRATIRSTQWHSIHLEFQFEAKLKPLYGSDIGYWDVPDMSNIAEAPPPTASSASQTGNQSLLFDNAISFWTANNPNFFKGTRVEAVVAQRRSELTILS
jgi:hypothetical protein